jgi:hypothetical protein
MMPAALTTMSQGPTRSASAFTAVSLEMSQVSACSPESRRFRVPIDPDDLDSHGRQGDGRRLTDPAARAGHDGPAALKAEPAGHARAPTG